MVHVCTGTQTKILVRPETMFENMSDIEVKYFSGFDKKTFNLVFAVLNVQNSPYTYYLSSKNQLALTMMKYCRGIDFILIGKLYNIPRKVVSNIFSHWTKQLYNYLRQIDF